VPLAYLHEQYLNVTLALTDPETLGISYNGAHLCSARTPGLVLLVWVSSFLCVTKLRNLVYGIDRGGGREALIGCQKPSRRLQTDSVIIPGRGIRYVKGRGIWKQGVILIDMPVDPNPNPKS